MIVICAYIPPQTDAARSTAFLEYFSDPILNLKGRYDNPYIIVGGDFNKQDINNALTDYPDLRQVDTPASGQGRSTPGQDVYELSDEDI